MNLTCVRERRSIDAAYWVCAVPRLLLVKHVVTA